MKNLPLVSVLIPTYNSSKDTNNLLEKLQCQTYKNLEVVIVDDSSDLPFELTKVYTFPCKVIRHEANKGLFEARRTGFKHSNGDLIVFLDSDDNVSCDWIRSLVYKQIKTKCDIVIGDFLLEKEGGFYFFSRSELWQTDFRSSSKIIFDKVIFQEGLDFSWTVVWNKIYKRSLIEKVYSLIPICSTNLVMCEDILLSVVAYFFAKEICNTHNNFYFYNKRNLTSSTGNASSLSKITKNIDDIIFVFETLTNILSENLTIIQKNKLTRWRDRIIVMWIKESKRHFNSPTARKIIKDYSLKLFNKISSFKQSEEVYFYKEERFDCFAYENIKKQISGSTIVTFDVFDTLIQRPFWNPSDIFELLNVYAQKIFSLTDTIDFSIYRKKAEKLTRNKVYKLYRRNEVTLDEIYQTLSQEFGFDQTLLDNIKDYEINLEKKFVYARESGLELFELARHLDKDVFIISDMYLPQNVIKEILYKIGVQDVEVRVSSSNFKTKSSGEAYEFLKGLGVPFEKILHIGDNYESDFEKAKAIGFNAALLPKAVDVFQGAYRDLYEGRVFNKVYEEGFALVDSRQSMNFFSTRCQLALVANQFFDNPYRSNNRSDFLSSHFLAGFMCLGMLNFGMCTWLEEKIRGNGYKSINFVARDGWLTMRCFQMLTEDLAKDYKVNYFPVSRRALLPLYYRTKQDKLNLINSFKLQNLKVSEILLIFDEFISREAKLRIEEFLRREKVTYEAFLSYKQLLEFLSEITPFDEKPNLFKEKYKNFFHKFFDETSVTFDVGYSCRTEYILKKLFGFEKINCLYFHLNNDKPLQRAQEASIDVQEFYPFTPFVKGTIRELVLSEVGPTCLSYKFDKEEIQPVYGEIDLSVSQQIALNLMHDGCLRFIEQIKRQFKDHKKEILLFRPFESSYPFEYFLNYSSFTDKENFEIFEFEDAFEKAKMQNLIDLWQEQVPRAITKTNELFSSDGKKSTKFAKALYWYITDKNIFKSKLKNKIQNEKLYSIVRWLNRKILKI